MAWNSCVEPEVPDSITGRASRNDASSRAAARILVMVLPSQESVGPHHEGLDAGRLYARGSPDSIIETRSRKCPILHATALLLERGKQELMHCGWAMAEGLGRCNCLIRRAIRSDWPATGRDGLLLGAGPAHVARAYLPAVQLGLERVAMQPEHARRLAHVTVHAVEGAQHDLALEAIARLVEREHVRLGRPHGPER